jgi:hypothetical protein
MLRWTPVSWTFQYFNFPIILRLPGRIPRRLAFGDGQEVQAAYVHL